MKTALTMAPVALLLATGITAQESAPSKWISLFDGKTLTGWKANEIPDKWTVVDGAIKTPPGRSHLFYTDGDFDDFELIAEVKTTPGSNSGIFFHTGWQAEGWLEQGYESQVNQSHRDPVRSGSLYNVIKLDESPARDGQWYEHRIRVQGQNIRIRVNGELVIDYTEPEGVTELRRLSHGTIALQGHDPNSVVYFRNLRIRSLD